MDQDKRITLAIALTFLALLAWRFFIAKQPPAGGKATQTQTAPAQQPSTPAEVPPANPTEASLSVRQGTQAEDIVIDGELYRVTLSTQGGVVKSWVLKKYEDENGKPLDVVNHEACETLGFPMSLSVGDTTTANKLNTALYVADASGNALKAPASVALVYSDGTTRAQKQFQFGADYEVHVEVSVKDRLGYKPVEVTWPGGFGDHSLPVATSDASTLAVYGAPGSITTLAQRKIKEDQLIPGPLVLAGAEDRYFASIFLPDSPEQAAFRVGRREWTPVGWKEKVPPKPLVTALGTPQPKPLAFRLVVTPKDLDVLRSVKPPLEGIVDLGWFSFVAKPLFLMLRYIYDHWIHNYGWAIIALTVFINFAMFPLKLKQIKSAQKMQQVQPIVKGIQDRYKQYKFNDPRKQRMQQEIMKVYSDHGINPLGGCLPMVIQLPFLYGFYSVLNLSIELRHAPWIACIRDLASPDRCHPLGIPVAILPTIMIVTMFFLQKMTPVATPDPAQQRMMLVMPLVFGAIFYNLASGLVLYYLTANVVGMAQQLFINKVAPVPALVPASRKTGEEKE